MTVEGRDVDADFGRLLEGLRTTLPGVQVLVGFLLTLPLQTRFESLGSFERTSYYVAFASSVTASILLIAPSAHQRLRAPVTGMTRKTPRHLEAAVRVSIVGTALFAVALVASVVLVTSIIVADDVPLVVVAGAVVVAVIAFYWFWQPLVSFTRDDDRPDDGRPDHGGPRGDDGTAS